MTTEKDKEKATEYQKYFNARKYLAELMEKKEKELAVIMKAYKELEQIQALLIAL